MLKNAGFAPPWVELQNDIRDKQLALEGWQRHQHERWPQLTPAEQARLYAEHERIIEELNKLITTYNLIVPAVVGQIALHQLWRERRKFETP